MKFCFLVYWKEKKMGAAASGVQTQMQAEHDPNAAFPWWVRFLAKGLGVFGGFVAIFFAVLGFISFSATCIIAVLLQLFVFLFSLPNSVF